MSLRQQTEKSVATLRERPCSGLPGCVIREGYCQSVEDFLTLLAAEKKLDAENNGLLQAVIGFFEVNYLLKV